MIIVFCTVDAAEVAQRLAAAVVEARLAACAAVSAPILSIYRWQGKVEEAREHQLVIKTRAALFPALEAFLRAHHPYEVPEILAVPVCAGSAPYMQWLAENTLEAPPPA